MLVLLSFYLYLVEEVEIHIWLSLVDLFKHLNIFIMHEYTLFYYWPFYQNSFSEIAKLLFISWDILNIDPILMLMSLYVLKIFAILSKFI